MNNIVSDKVKNFYTNKLEYLKIYIDCKILFLRFYPNEWSSSLDRKQTPAVILSSD